MNHASASQSADPAANAAGLRIVLGKLIRRLRREGGADDLTSSQKVVINLLEQHGASTVSTLARIENVRPQSMGATVSALEAAGLVAGTPDPADGRQTLLSLTPACREMLLAGRAAREDWLLRIINEKLDPSEQAELARAIRLLARFVE